MNELDLYTIALPIRSDAFALYNCVDRNREHLKNLTWAQTATEGSVREFLHSVIADRLEDFRLILQNGLVVVGAVTLRDKGEHLEIGYWLDHGCRAKGVMTKCVGEILRDADKPVMARVRIQNWASRRVLIKNGFFGTVDETNEWIIYSWTP